MGKNRTTRRSPSREKASARTATRKAAATQAAAGPRLLRHAPWIALLLITLAAYLPALRATFIWDDDALTRNPLVAAPAGLFELWFAPARNTFETHYWPLVYSSFWAEYRLWGLAAPGYHLDNILLHALCAVLLWRLLKRLAVPGAWLAAALFALHPVHVESVAWAIERKDVLSGAFYLGAALAWLRYERTRRPAAFGLVALLFICALLCKSIVVTLPFALALLIWWREGRLARRDLVPLAALLLPALALTAADLLLFAGRNIMPNQRLLPLFGRIQMAGGALWVYFYKLAWPASLAALYPQWRVDPAAPLLWLPLAAALGLAALLWAWRGRLGRGPLAAALFFALTLAPALGLVWFDFMTLAWVADRFQYLASIGPLVLAAALLAARVKAPLARAAAVALLLVLGGLTWRQASLYQSEADLFGRNVQRYPTSWAAHYQLGGALADRSQFQEAAAQYEEARRQHPDGYGMIYHELAMAEARLGQPRQARQNFEIALQMMPDYFKGYNNYGALLNTMGLYDEAIAQFNKALKLRHDPPALLLANLGKACLGSGRLAQGLDYLQQAIGQDPMNPEYHNLRAQALAAARQGGAAAAEYEASLKLDPADGAVQAALGVLLLGLNNPAGALEHLEQARALGLDDAQLYFSLGEAQRLAGHWAEAGLDYREALRRQPNFPGAAQRLAECERKRQ